MDGERQAAQKTNEELDWRLRYDWGLGAGLGFSRLAALGSLEGATGVPGYQLSLERRVGERTWLIGNAMFQNNVGDLEIESEIDPSLRRKVERASNAIGALIGLRHAIVSGLVEVSVLGVVGGSYSWVGGPRPREDEMYGSFSTLPGSKGKVFEVLAGLSVERELIEALALRLSTSVVGLRVSDVSEVVEDGAELRRRERSFRGFGLELSPALEVRFYF